MATEMPDRKCYACGGRGSLMALDGYMRPCSRCCPDAFSAWYAAKRDAEPRPTPQEKDL